MPDVRNVKLVSGGDMMQKTTSYIITTLLGKQIEFNCDVSFNPNDATFTIFDSFTEQQFIDLLNNLNRAFRNKFIGHVEITYDTDDNERLKLDLDGDDIQIE